MSKSQSGPSKGWVIVVASMGRMIVGRGASTAPLKSLTTEDTEKGLGFDTAVGPGELCFMAGRRRNLETVSTTLSALLFSFFFLLCSPAASVVMPLFLFPDPPWPLPFALLVVSSLCSSAASVVMSLFLFPDPPWLLPVALLVVSPLCSSAASVVMLLYSVSDRAWPLPSPAMEL